MKTLFSRLFPLLLCILLLLSFAACDAIRGLLNLPGAEAGQFTAYRNQVTKDEFQKQYAQAFNSKQPDYTKDFVYIYINDSREESETGEDTQTTNERIEYDAENKILLYHYEFKNNDPDDPADESYFWEYREENGMLLFYDSRTGNTQTRALGFGEFWEFAKSQVPLILLPNPNKLYNDSTYYIDLNKDGDKVFTLYSGDENDYSLRQVVLCGTELLYRTKSYQNEDGYEAVSININHVYNENVTLTPHS